MSYRIATHGVIRLADNAVLRPGHDGWTAYEEWLRSGGAPQPAIEPPRWKGLAEIKAEYMARVRIARARHEHGGFAFRSRRLDSDTEARVRLISAVLAALVARITSTSTPFAREWVAADGSVITLDTADMLALATALADHDNACAARAASLKAQIIAAPDMQSVQDLDINVGWPA